MFTSLVLVSSTIDNEMHAVEEIDLAKTSVSILEEQVEIWVDAVQHSLARAS